MAYRRFRHFGKDKVTMDFAFFAIAFNLKKMIAKMNLGGLKHNLDCFKFIFTLQNAFAAISEYLTIKNKENSQLKCISKLRVLIYIEGVFELLTHPPIFFI